MTRLFANRLLALVTLIVLVLGSVCTSFAQSRYDPGRDEPYHPALVNYRVGLFYQMQGRHKQAIVEFTQSIDGLPAFGYAYAARGDSYAALGNYARAIEDYNQAVDIYPDYVSALYTRGRAYDALGEPERAIADYRNAISQMPEYANPYWGLGDLFYGVGVYANALEEYRTYISLVEGVPAERVLERIGILETMTAAAAL